MSSTITFITSEGENFTVNKKAAMMNETVKNLVMDLDDQVSIPIPNLSKAMLLTIMEWCEHYANKSSESEEFEHDAEFDAKFLDDYTRPKKDSKSILNVDALVELLEAANFMSNRKLMDIVCSKAADCIRGKSIEEIQKDYGICPECRGEGTCEHGLTKTAFSEEEEQEMRKIKPYEEWVKEIEEHEKKTE